MIPSLGLLLVLIGRNCSNLKVLKWNITDWLVPSEHRGIVPGEYWKAYKQNGYSEAAVIVKSLPHLEWLEIRFSWLSAEGLNLIDQGCPTFESLVLPACHNITNRDIANASPSLLRLEHIEKPNSYYPKFSSFFHAESYGHLRLYDERFQRNVFRMWQLLRRLSKM
jgi:F-box/leucine-rich repeat protein 2/20